MEKVDRDCGEKSVLQRQWAWLEMVAGACVLERVRQDGLNIPPLARPGSLPRVESKDPDRIVHGFVGICAPSMVSFDTGIVCRAHRF